VKRSAGPIKRLYYLTMLDFTCCITFIFLKIMKFSTLSNFKACLMLFVRSLWLKYRLNKMGNPANNVNVDHTLAEYLTIIWFCLTLYLLNILRKFANRNQFNWHTYITVFIAYFASFGIILLIPIDVGLTIVGRSENVEIGERTTYEKYSTKIENMYNSLYWPGLTLQSLFDFAS